MYKILCAFLAIGMASFCEIGLTAEEVPLDTCVLELTLPGGATVVINGNDYGAERRLTFSGLQPGQRYSSKVLVTYANGEQERRDVIVQGGRLISEHFGPLTRLAEPAVPERAPAGAKPELVVQTGHSQGASCAALTPDDRYLATGGTLEGTIVLWDVATGRKLRSFDRTTEDADVSACNVECIDFSPDGELLLSGYSDGMIIIWEKTTGTIRRRFQAGDGYVSSMAFSPRGDMVLVKSVRGVTLWDTASGAAIRTLQSPRTNAASSIQTVDISPAGTYVAAGYNKGTTTIWNAASGAVIRTFSQDRTDPSEVSMDSYAQTFEAGGQDLSLEMARRIQDEVLTPEVQAIAFNSDETVLATAASNGTVMLWDVRTGRKLQVMKVQAFGQMKSVVFSRDGRKLLCCPSGMAATLWDVATGRQLRATTSPALSVAFSPESTRMLTGHQDGTVSMRDIREIKALWTISAADLQVNLLAFSPNGEEFVSGSMMGKSAILWSAADGHKLREFVVPPMMINISSTLKNQMGSQGLDISNRGNLVATVFVAEGRRLVTASLHMDMGFQQSANRRSTGMRTTGRSYQHTLKLTAWDVATGRSVWDVDLDWAVTFRSGTFALSPDRRNLLVGGPMGTTILDQDGNKIFTLPGRDYPNLLQSTAFSPTNRSLVMCMENTASLLNPNTGSEIRRFAGHVGAVSCVAFSPNGKKLVTGSADRTAILWDVATGRKLHVLRGHKELLLLAEFSPDGKTVLTSGKDDTSILWNAESGEALYTLLGSSARDPGMTASSGQTFAPSGSFTPDSQFVLTTGSMGGCHLWDVATGESRYDSRGATGSTIAVALAQQGDPLIVGRLNEGEIVVTDAASGHVLTSVREHSSTLNSLSVASNTGETLVSVGGMSGGVVLWDPAFQRGTRLAMGETFFNSMFSSATLSPDGRRIATSSYTYGSDVTIWDVPLGNRLCKLETGENTRCLTFSSEGEQLITGDSKRNAIVWNATTGAKLHTLQTASDVDAATFSPDGRHLLTCGGEKTAILWDTTTWQKAQELTQGERVDGVAFAANGERVATSSSRMIVIWDTRNGRQKQTIQTDDTFEYLAFGPNGETIVTGEAHRGGTVTMWSVSTGKKLKTFRGHTGGILSANFRADGKVLVTGSKDGTVRFWETATGDELARLIHLDGGKDWLAVTPDGLFDGSAGGRENVMFRFGGGLNVVSVDRFFQDFYYPGLLTAIINGARPQPDVQLAASVPPMVRIVQPQQGGPVDGSTVTVLVEATDQGGGIRGPWLRQDGTRVDALAETVREGNTIRRTFVIDLVEGENRLEFQAASADGSWESEPAVITFVCEESLPRPDLYLVSVGINDYEGQKMDMEYAVPDALAMAGLFDERGRELYEDVHITTLTDAQATSSAILQTIRDAGRQARPQDTMAVFLAGQGTVVQQQYYFVPGDFQRKNDSLEDDVQTQALLASQINDVLGSAKALRRMLVFDTGQSGGDFGLTRTARNPFAFRGAVERLARSQGTFAIAAAAISEKAVEVDQLEHGVLTYSLLAGLRAVNEGPLADQWIEPSGGDRVADVLEWFGFASARVPQLTRQYFQQSQDIQHCSAGTSFPVLPVPETTRVPESGDIAEFTPPKQQRPTEVVEGRGDSDLYVVAVGINRYAESSMNLQYATGDAQAIGELFHRRGVVLFRNVHVKEILDEQATQAGILKSLEEVASQVQPDDTLVVFLGGHGKMVGQRYYFIPHEFRFEADSFEDDIREQGLAADVLGEAISQVSASKRLLILDTCASGGALSISRQGRDPFAFRGAIEKLGTSPGVFTIAASAAGEEAQEIAELGHGVLTYALLAGLRAVPPGGPLDNLAIQPAGPAGRADVLEWFSYASGHVPRLTKRYLGQEQDVQTSGHGTSFLVLPVMKRADTMRQE